MDFIDWASHEYRLTKNKLVWHETVLTLWNAKFTPVFLLIFGIVVGVSFGFGLFADFQSGSLAENPGNEPWRTLDRLLRYLHDMLSSLGAGPVGISAILGIALGALSVLALVFAYFLAWAVWLVPFYYFVYFMSNKRFRTQVGLLSPAQNEMLLAEYLSSRKIEIPDYGRKALVKPVGIYLTENFLFIPGLLLELREYLTDVHVQSSYNKKKKNSRIYFYAMNHDKDKVYLYLLPIAFSHQQSPEIAEQIMAWFWQCDPTDPGLSQRVNDIVIWVDDAPAC